MVASAMLELEACLPVALRGPTTKIEKIAAGLSGAGVYRVDAGAAGAFVLKVAGDPEAADGWDRTVAIQRSAGEAGLAPRVVHVDATRRAVVSELIVDRSMAMRVGHPATRELAIDELGRLLRGVHALPIPQGAKRRDVRGMLAEVWGGLDAAGFARPAWCAEVVTDLLAAPVPAGREVLSHNDANPTNLVFDGARVLLLDWDAAAPNDVRCDLATVSVFLRMDAVACARLCAAHGNVAVDAGFAYWQRLIAATCGTIFLHLARTGGHGGSTEASPVALAELYLQMRSGALAVSSPAGQWAFGLALLAEKAERRRT
jgi:aminoglycoside phosphotransferase (APT) family kinase protein